nr:hypothetical protein Iba_chr04bCG10050 [Ipomoea batatas]GME14265.1 hypothetical protein Iba_scaffold15124CG0050 [Ipomoea batatas]
MEIGIDGSLGNFSPTRGLFNWSLSPVSSPAHPGLSGSPKLPPITVPLSTPSVNVNSPSLSPSSVYISTAATPCTAALSTTSNAALPYAEPEGEYAWYGITTPFPGTPRSANETEITEPLAKSAVKEEDTGKDNRTFAEVGGDGVVGGGGKENIFVEKDTSLGGSGTEVLLMAESSEEDEREEKDEESVHGF